MSFTPSQNKALAIIPKVPGSFSAVGSSFILYEILSDRRRWTRPYHRLMFSMCVFDVCSSVALAMSTWPIPESSPAFGASGNTATCTAQAFFIQANIASPIYNCMLSVFFLLQVKHSRGEHYLKTRVEPLMQSGTVLFALGTSFVCLGLGLFHDSALWCWIKGGGSAEIFRWLFFFGPLWAAVIGSMIAMTLLYQAVKRQEKIAHGWEFPSLETANTIATATSTTPIDRRLQFQQSKAKYRKSRVVAIQALRYVGVFYLTWVAGTTNRLLQLIVGRSYFWIMALHAFFTPMQGFFNFLVYKYPKMDRRREATARRSMMNLQTSFYRSTRWSLNMVSRNDTQNNINNSNFNPHSNASLVGVKSEVAPVVAEPMPAQPQEDFHIYEGTEVSV